MKSAATLDPIRAPFRAVTVACAPAAEGLSAEGWARAETIVNGALADRPPSVRRQLVLFVRVLGVLAVLRFGRPLVRLAPAQTGRLLGALERSPFLLLRRGTWGLRTLAFMGYYGQEEVRMRLGYRATGGGWAHRAIEQSAWPDRKGVAPAEAGVLTSEPGGCGADVPPESPS